MKLRYAFLILSAFLTLTVRATATDSLLVKWVPGTEFPDTVLPKFRLDTVSPVGKNLVRLIEHLANTRGWQNKDCGRMSYENGEVWLGGINLDTKNVDIMYNRRSIMGVIELDDLDKPILLNVYPDEDGHLPQIVVPTGKVLLTVGITPDVQKEATQQYLALYGKPKYVWGSSHGTMFHGQLDYENNWIMPRAILIDDYWIQELWEYSPVDTVWKMFYRDWGLNIPENSSELISKFLKK